MLTRTVVTMPNRNVNPYASLMAGSWNIAL